MKFDLLLKRWYNIRDRNEFIVKNKEERDMSNVEVRANSSRTKEEGFSREFDEDFPEEPTWKDILNFFKKKMPEKKKLKRNGRIAVIWRVINWLIVYAVSAKFITFLFNKTPLGYIYKVIPGVPWLSATKMIFFFFCLCVALAASYETNKDDFRFAAGVALISIPTILMLVVGEAGLFSLFIAGSVTFSIYREKIYTDAKVRRTAPKKDRTDIDLDKENGKVTIDRYQV